MTRNRRQGSVLGPIDAFLESAGAPVPEVSMNERAADISGKLSSSFRIGIGVGILERILTGFGLSGVKLGFAFSGAQEMSFRFGDVRIDRVHATAIGEYLRSATPRLDSILIDSVDGRGEAAIITDVLKSNSFDVIVKDRNGSEMDIDIAGLQKAIDLKSSILVSRNSDRSVNFRSDRHLTFGFKGFLFWINLESGGFHLEPPPGGDGHIGPLFNGLEQSQPNRTELLFDQAPVALDFPRSVAALAPQFGHFEGEVVARWLRHDGADRRMELIEEVRYIDPSGRVWRAPAGRIVDGASIPPAFWSVVGPPYVGDYRRATVIHDIATADRAATSHQTHRAFFHAMRCDGVPEIKAHVMYQAVLRFGPRWDAAGVTMSDLSAAGPIDAQTLVDAVYRATAVLPPEADPDRVSECVDQILHTRH
ncbi:MAG: DUF1353 domain-containing protein [Phycisphaerales bacterium JB050]